MSRPTFEDAQLLLSLYELRRDPHFAWPGSGSRHRSTRSPLKSFSASAPLAPIRKHTSGGPRHVRGKHSGELLTKSWSDWVLEGMQLRNTGSYSAAADAFREALTIAESAGLSGRELTEILKASSPCARPA